MKPICALLGAIAGAAFTNALWLSSQDVNNKPTVLFVGSIACVGLMLALRYDWS